MNANQARDAVYKRANDVKKDEVGSQLINELQRITNDKINAAISECTFEASFEIDLYRDLPDNLINVLKGKIQDQEVEALIKSCVYSFRQEIIKTGFSISTILRTNTLRITLAW